MSTNRFFYYKSILVLILFWKSTKNIALTLSYNIIDPLALQSPKGKKKHKKLLNFFK